MKSIYLGDVAQIVTLTAFCFLSGPSDEDIIGFPKRIAGEAVGFWKCSSSSLD
jgi:hypothetical protein